MLWAIMPPTSSPAARRPLKSRGAAPITGLASALASRRVTPNAISLASVAFAALGAAALLAGPEADGAARVALLAGAAICVQLRLLCNVIDGLVAVEGGLGGPDGEIFNDAPDRAADALLLVAAGYAGGAPELGWAAALLAVLTAYVRLLGGTLGLPQDFSGVMSKPRRMALLTLACLLAIADLRVLAVAAGLVAAGSALTCAGRLQRIRRRVHAR